jgi:hypothetical protein
MNPYDYYEHVRILSDNNTWVGIIKQIFNTKIVRAYLNDPLFIADEW